MKNKAQMQISFGVIFSIFLIIVFITFAIYGIGKFLELKNIAEVEDFKIKFQGDIEKMWEGSGNQEVTAGPYYLPEKIKQVCFVNDEYENMYFVPGNFEGEMLENIDFTKTLSGLEPLCISTSDGKISITISKAYDNKNGVTIAR
jgi:hypothetical protein